MWIMLICKLPTAISPPKMSIFWSVPWKGEHGEKAYRAALLAAWVRHKYGEDGPKAGSFLPFSERRRDVARVDELRAEMLKAIDRADARSAP